ncbi:MAG: DNA translocase FtsK [Ruminococcaceae bacterium]|nr:DNA translocase FtsK [Oscillospiraceae bacterium]
MPAKKKTTTSSRSTKKQKQLKNSYIYDTVVALVLMLIAVIMFFGLFSNSLGIIGSLLNGTILGLFGIGGILIPFAFIFTAVLLIAKKKNASMKFALAMLFILLLSAFANVFCGNADTEYFASGKFSDNFTALTTDLFNDGLEWASGGVLGGWLCHLLVPLFGKLGAGIIIFVVMLAAFILTTGLTFADFKLPSRPEYPEDKKSVANQKAENKALKKDIKAMQKEIDTLKKQKFVIPEVDEPEKATKKQETSPMQLELEKIEEPYKEKRSFFKKDKAVEIKEKEEERDAELQKNKEEFDDLLFQFKAKSSVNVTPSYAHGVRPQQQQTPVTPLVSVPEPETKEVEPQNIEQKQPEPIREKAPEPIKETPVPEVKKTIFGKEKELSAEEKFEQAAIREAEIAKQQSEEITKMLEKAESEETQAPKNIYKLPPLNMLTYTPDTNAESYKEELKLNATKLTDALATFNVQATVVDAKRGPTVTRYELTPDPGVKISKFTGLSDDIALHLAAQSVRIEAPIPGKAAIGVEIPNKSRSTVYLKEIVASDEFKNHSSKISVALGKDISGQATVIDLAKMPHLLIAGATGSGKSICINSILMSLLYKSTPDEVKLLLVDPKVVELSIYNGIPHLLIPVVTDPEKASGALAWAVSEMLNRYKLFADKSVRDFNGYNKSLGENEKKLPQIVIVIDELADLMMAAPTEVEDSICRLAQMARAAGMHLVIATQRPSADVITGIIKANIPSRIAFAVSSSMNSRIILDASGAEKLVGRGDMLYNPLGATKPLRVQGSFVSDGEVENVVNFIKENYVSEYDNSILEKIEQNVNLQKTSKRGGVSAASSDDDDGPEDEKLNEAIRCVVENGQASVSMLQRKIGLGFSRAGKLIDEMEKRGIVGPYQGSKPREVLITKAQWLEIQARREDQ